MTCTVLKLQGCMVGHWFFNDRSMLPLLYLWINTSKQWFQRINSYYHIIYYNIKKNLEISIILHHLELLQHLQLYYSPHPYQSIPSISGWDRPDHVQPMFHTVVTEGPMAKSSTLHCLLQLGGRKGGRQIPKALELSAFIDSRFET